ncbi:MAG TPA: formyltransferase family protein [Acidobacteriota bacterium]
MRILFFGYSQIGFSTLQLLVQRGDEVAAVVSHRDDPAEDRWYRTPADAARTFCLPLAYEDELAGRMASYARHLEPDLILSIFYRKLLSSDVLAAAKIAALNLHPSLLPAYRGRCPINWVLIHGETYTGVSLHHMVERADAGNIVAQRRVEITARETALSLYRKIENEALILMSQTLPLLAEGRAPRFPQEEERATYFGARRPEDGRIDWSWPADRIDRLVRAVAPPWPGAFGDVEGCRLSIHSGEPADPIESVNGSRAAPGTVRRSNEKLFIATGDRWFRIEEAVPI